MKNSKKHVNLILCFFSLTIFYMVPNLMVAYTPKKGDLLFQDLNCGSMCDAITSVTYGYNHTQVSHVAMVVGSGHNPEVIEAIGNDVHLIDLKDFLARSVDKNGKPRVIVGRLKSGYQPLIPIAIKQSLSWVGLPYNDGFTPNNHFQKFYCSQLLYDAFMLANHGKPIFKQQPMTFEINGQLLPSWKAYFESIKKHVPERELGTNPGMLSRSDKLNIIYSYSHHLRHISSLS